MLAIFIYEKNNDFPCSYFFLYESLFYYLDIHGLRCYVLQMAKAIGTQQSWCLNIGGRLYDVGIPVHNTMDSLVKTIFALDLVCGRS